MTEQAERIKKALNNIYIDKDVLNELCKDRLDFGFDSIYFRYAALRDELMLYKIMYDKGDIKSEKMRANHDKIHFYNTLEQLIHAHEKEEKA